MFSISPSISLNVRAFSPRLPGHCSIHTPQPVQSAIEIEIAYCNPSNPLPIAGSVTTPSGAFFNSSSVAKNGLITACGHTNAHWLHWIQFSGNQ